MEQGQAVVMFEKEETFEVEEVTFEASRLSRSKRSLTNGGTPC